MSIHMHLQNLIILPYLDDVFLPLLGCLFGGQANPSLSGAFGTLENVALDGKGPLASAADSKAFLIQAVNVPSMISTAFIANSTIPEGSWTADVSYAMPEYNIDQPSASLNFNWLFAKGDCDDFAGMNYGSVDVSYTSTKSCVPLPVQDISHGG